MLHLLRLVNKMVQSLL